MPLIQHTPHPTYLYPTYRLSSIPLIQRTHYPTYPLSNIPLIQRTHYPIYPLSNMPLIQHTPYPTYPLSNITLIQHTPYPTYPLSNRNHANNKQIICFKIRIHSTYNIDNYSFTIGLRVLLLFYILNEAAAKCSNNDL